MMQQSGPILSGSPSARRPLLSICIATLNRVAYISATLESIIRQITDEVEIVVLDGASTDGTEEIMLALAKTCPNMRYIRQGRNCGLDQDYSTAVESCRGEYVWLMTDDDLFIGGAIAAVVKAISGRPSLVVVNAEVRNADMSRILQARRLEIDADTIIGCNDMDTLLALAGSYLSFIGCVVIRRELWMTRKTEPYFGTLFIHVGVIFQEPLPSHTVIIAQPLVSIRYGNAMWRPREFEIWMFKWPLLVWSFSHISTRAKAAVTAAEPWRDAKVLLLYRAKGSYTKQAYEQWLRAPLGGSARGFIASVIAHLPGVLVNGAAVVYGHLSNRGIHTGLIDLKASRFYFRNQFSSRRG